MNAWTANTRAAMAALLVLAASGHVSGSALGQGTVVFSNGPGGLVQRWTNQGIETPIPVSSTDVDYVQLVYAPAGTPAGPYGWRDGAFVGYQEGADTWVADNPGWMLGPRTGISTNEAGRFEGGVVSLAGIPAGGQASYAVFGAAGGVDYTGSHIQDLYQGLSPVFTTATGADAASAVPLAEWFDGVTLIPVTSWPLLLAPSLRIVRAPGSAVVIIYQGTLQSATSAGGPYTDVAGATNPYTVPAGGPAMFFRSYETYQYSARGSGTSLDSHGPI